MGETETVAADQNEAVTPEAILQLGLAFWGSKTLLSAIELGVFSELAGGASMDADELRERLGLHRRSATDFFDALVALGMLERDDGRYSNTPATELFLDRAKPSYAGGILEMANARLFGFWGSLTEGLRTGEPQNEGKEGGDFFAALYADPERLAQFARAMSSVSAGAGHAIAAKSRGRSTGRSSTSAARRARCRFRSRSPTTTSPALGSTCPRWLRSSTTTSRGSDWPTA